MFTFKFIASGAQVLSMTFSNLDASSQASLIKSARTFFSQNPNDVEVLLISNESEESAYDMQDLKKLIEEYSQ